MQRAAKAILDDLERLASFYRAHKPGLTVLKVYPDDYRVLKDGIERKSPAVVTSGVLKRGDKLMFDGFELTQWQQ